MPDTPRTVKIKQNAAVCDRPKVPVSGRYDGGQSALLSTNPKISVTPGADGDAAAHLYVVFDAGGEQCEHGR